MKKKTKVLISVLTAVSILISAFAITANALYFGKTEEIENTFLPENVENPVLTCEVYEDGVDFSAQTKTNIKVKNTGNIKGFVRLKPNVKLVNDDGEVYFKRPVGYYYNYSEHDNKSYTEAGLGAKFDYVFASRAESLTYDYNVCLGADSFYYYTVALDPGESALFFDEIYLTNANGENTCPEGYHYQVEFIAEIIDVSSADSVWDVSVPTATGDDVTLMVNNEASGGYYDEKYLCWY